MEWRRGGVNGVIFNNKLNFVALLLSKPKGEDFSPALKMDKERKLVDKFGRDPGFKAPEGFLEDVYKQVAEKRGQLPEYKHDIKVGVWHRLRPYVYLAAMFAGIWCMMKVFSVASEQTNLTSAPIAQEQTVSLDNPPAMIAEAAVSLEVVKELQISEELNDPATTDYELEQDMQNNYSDFEDFEEAFDYDFDQRYSSIDVDEIVSEAENTEVTASNDF